MDLRGADLSYAWLGCTYVPNCMGAANMSDSDLRDADLSNADIEGVLLFYAQLQDADFDGAYLQYAQLGGANLTGARNLDKANDANWNGYLS